MQYIDFNVQHQTITRTDNYEVVGNSENYLYARFEFCAEWDDIIPTAVFSANNGKHISVLIENGECLVPWEMLRVPEFWVGVFGGDRQTTDTARVGVKPGVKFNAKPGVEPTPTAYEKLMNELRDGITQMEEHAENVEGNAEEAAASAEDAAASAAIAENSAATADSAKDVVLNALNNVPAGSTVIVNDLTTGGTAAALSAEMGKALEQNKVDKSDKPSGTYTGTGDAAVRNINVGGIGKIIAIASESGMAFVGSAGAITQYGDSISGLWGDAAGFHSGYLYLATTNARVNKSGVTYTYQVL